MAIKDYNYKVKNEILDTMEQIDTNPRYRIRANNGDVLQDDVQIELKTPVIEEGTALDRNGLALYEEIARYNEVDSYEIVDGRPYYEEPTITNPSYTGGMVLFPRGHCRLENGKYVISYSVQSNYKQLQLWFTEDDLRYSTTLDFDIGETLTAELSNGDILIVIRPYLTSNTKPSIYTTVFSMGTHTFSTVTRSWTTTITYSYDNDRNSVNPYLEIARVGEYVYISPATGYIWRTTDGVNYESFTELPFYGDNTTTQRMNIGMTGSDNTLLLIGQGAQEDHRYARIYKIDTSTKEKTLIYTSTRTSDGDCGNCAGKFIDGGYVLTACNSTNDYTNVFVLDKDFNIVRTETRNTFSMFSSVLGFSQNCFIILATNYRSSDSYLGAIYYTPRAREVNDTGITMKYNRTYGILPKQTKIEVIPNSRGSTNLPEIIYEIEMGKINNMLISNLSKNPPTNTRVTVKLPSGFTTSNMVSNTLNGKKINTILESGSINELVYNGESFDIQRMAVYKIPLYFGATVDFKFANAAIVKLVSGLIDPRYSNTAILLRGMQDVPLYQTTNGISAKASFSEEGILTISAVNDGTAVCIPI